MDCKKELKKKLSASYERLVKQWMASDPAQLIEAAEEIAAARFIHACLTDSVSDWDTAFLLTLEDPLEELSAKWREENGPKMVHDDDLRHCVFSLSCEHNVDLEAFEEGGDMRLC